MRILFIIAVLSCAALVWAAISIARHVKKGHTSKNAGEGQSFSDALMRASYQDPPVAGRRVKPHPREDFAAGAGIGTGTKARPGIKLVAEETPEDRADKRYSRGSYGDLSDPDTNRISGVLPNTNRRNRR